MPFRRPFTSPPALVVAVASQLATALDVAEAQREQVTGGQEGLGWRNHFQRLSAKNFARHAARDRRRVATLLAADAVSVGASFAALAVAAAELSERLHLAPQSLLATPVFEVVVVAVTMALALGTYGQGDARRDSARLIFAGFLSSGVLVYAGRQADGGVAAAAMLLLGCVLGTSLLAGRSVVDAIVRWRRRVGNVETPAIALCCAKDCGALPIGFAEGNGDDLRVVNRLDLEPGGSEPSELFMRRLHGSLDGFSAAAIVCCPHVSPAALQAVVDVGIAAGCSVLTGAPSGHVAGVVPRITWRHGNPMLEFTAPALTSHQLFLKRLIDVVVSLLLLIALTPLLAIVAILIRATSRGPVLFMQERVGMAGRRFRILKFRTMVADAEARRVQLEAQSMYGASGLLFKLEHDPRVTPLGRWLRRTSIDELPQLWNVLRGDMSLVGPRPPLPSEVERYRAHHYVRFDVLPGITGPWQVSGRNKITDFEKVIELEFRYIREWTLMSDISILARTVGEVLRMRGAH